MTTTPSKQLFATAAAMIFVFGAVAIRAQSDKPSAPAASETAATSTPQAPPDAPPVVTAPKAPLVLQPAVKSLREVELGMSVGDVKKKLGRPEVEDASGMYFTLSGGDSVQIGLNADKKVRTIATIYAAGSKAAPSLTEILGKDVEAADGDVYKMVRYPDAGYWVSYSRTNSKDKPIVVVTMKKIS